MYSYQMVTQGHFDHDLFRNIDICTFRQAKISVVYFNVYFQFSLYIIAKLRHCDHSAAWSMTIDVIRELRHFCLCSHFCKRLPSKRKWYFYTKISHKPRAQNISSTAVVALHNNTKGRLSLVLWAIVISKIMVVLLHPKGSSISLGMQILQIGLNHKKKQS